MKQYRKKIFLFPLIAFFLVFGMCTSVFLLIENKFYYQKREQFLYLAANESNIIDGCLDTVIARAYTLSAMLEENDGKMDFFDKVSKKIYDEVYKDTGVKLKNIAIAPNGVVEKVYPLIGNESLIGFNFMDESKEGNKEVQEALLKGDIVMTEPFELQQGGMGIAARLPVMLSDNESSKLWGIVTITFDYDDLMDYFKLCNLKNLGADYCLWYSLADNRPIVLQQSEKAPIDAVTYDVQVKNLVWHLEVSPIGGWYSKFEIISGMFLIFFISSFMGYFVSTKERIKMVNADIINANKKLEYLATRDSLTSCYSRHYVNSTLLNLPEGNWTDTDKHYSLAIIDIDEFKSINDTYGHDVGDDVIAAVASVLREICNEINGDCVIRHGGDEFVILLNNMDYEKLKKRMTTLLFNIRNIRIAGYPMIHITISAGVMLCDDKINKYYDMLSNADEKLYQSKQNGRNCFTL